MKKKTRVKYTEVHTLSLKHTHTHLTILFEIIGLVEHRQHYFHLIEEEQSFKYRSRLTENLIYALIKDDSSFESTTEISMDLLLVVHAIHFFFCLLCYALRLIIKTQFGCHNLNIFNIEVAHRYDTTNEKKKKSNRIKENVQTRINRTVRILETKNDQNRKKWDKKVTNQAYIRDRQPTSIYKHNTAIIIITSVIRVSFIRR